MSQRFKLQLATTSLLSDAKQLNASVEQLYLIQVIVDITLIEPSKIELTYQIQLPNSQLATQFNWSHWQQQRVKFTDYLWEQTCLECFIAGRNLLGDATGYIEVNASPNGSYALYRFVDYRQPDCMPPTPLYKVNNNERAHINWPNNASLYNTGITSKISLSKCPDISDNSLATLSFKPYYHYARRFIIDIDQLVFASVVSSYIKPTIEQIHPCVILYFDNVSLYFAPKHATPPDFHQRQYWASFNS